MNYATANFATLKHTQELPLSAHSLSALPAPKLDRAYLPFDVEAASVVLRFVDGSRMMIPAADLLDPKALLHFADCAAPLGGTGFQENIELASELQVQPPLIERSLPTLSQAARFFDSAAEAHIALTENSALHSAPTEPEPMRVELVKPVEVIVNPNEVTAALSETVDFFLAPPTSVHNDNPPHVLGNSFGNYVHALRA